MDFDDFEKCGGKPSNRSCCVDSKDIAATINFPESSNEPNPFVSKQTAHLGATEERSWFMDQDDEDAYRDYFSKFTVNRNLLR